MYHPRADPPRENEQRRRISRSIPLGDGVQSQRKAEIKPRRGVVANMLNAFRNGNVGFIDWLDGSGVNIEL